MQIWILLAPPTIINNNKKTAYLILNMILTYSYYVFKPYVSPNLIYFNVTRKQCKLY